MARRLNLHKQAGYIDADFLLRLHTFSLALRRRTIHFGNYGRRRGLGGHPRSPRVLRCSCSCPQFSEDALIVSYGRANATYAAPCGPLGLREPLAAITM